MKLIEPLEILKAVYQSIDWARLYEAAPEITREDVEEVLREIGESLPKRMLRSEAGGRGEEVEVAEEESAVAASEQTPAPEAPPLPASAKLDHLIVRTDGASLGNPGPAGAGVVITAPNGATVEKISRALGRMTNNQAEYEALLIALERARRLGASQVSMRTDSELMVRQIKGVYRVKNPGLQRLHRKVEALLTSFEKWDIRHTPREENALADKLAGEGARKKMMSDGR